MELTFKDNLNRHEIHFSEIDNDNEVLIEIEDCNNLSTFFLKKQNLKELIDFLNLQLNAK